MYNIPMCKFTGPDDLSIIIYGNDEYREVPHFHVVDLSGRECCISLLKSEYIDDHPNIDKKLKLTKRQIKKLAEFMDSPHEIYDVDCSIPQ